MAKYAALWNAYYDDTHNRVDGIRRLRPIIDEACKKEARDPETLERTVTVLLADETADPWWDRLPSSGFLENTPLKPVMGAPEQIAETLLAYHKEGISHIQICLDPTTCQTVESLSAVLEILDKSC